MIIERCKSCDCIMDVYNFSQKDVYITAKTKCLDCLEIGVYQNSSCQIDVALAKLLGFTILVFLILFSLLVIILYFSQKYNVPSS